MESNRQTYLKIIAGLIGLIILLVLFIYAQIDNTCIQYF